MAGLVTLQFLKHLMELNPSLRPPVKRTGLDELELWETLWTSVYAAPFDAMTMAGLAASHGPDGVDGQVCPEATEVPAPAGGSVIGEALLWTLESCFRADFTPEARAAWETLYRFVNHTAWTADEDAQSPAHCECVAW